MLHFYCESNAKTKLLRKLSRSIPAYNEIYTSPKELARSLSVINPLKQHIIILERSSNLTEHQKLHIYRTFPTIVLDMDQKESSNIDKKHEFWKTNCFFVGSSLNTIDLDELKLAIQSLFIKKYSILDTVSWSAVSKKWITKEQSTSKLSEFISQNIRKANPHFGRTDSIIEFAKYIQNKTKGKGTFKSVEFSIIIECSKILLVAKLNWPKKTEQSLRSLFNGLQKFDFNANIIRITDPKKIELYGVWDTLAQTKDRRCSAIMGLNFTKVPREIKKFDPANQVLPDDIDGFKESS